MDWKQRVLDINALVRNEDDAGRKGTAKALDLSQVLWTIWSDDGMTPKFRVVRGRDLAGPGLRHGVIKVENEMGALDLAESLGDPIPTKADGKTLDVPKPAVPKAHIAMIMSHPVMLYDGTEMAFEDIWAA